MNRSLLSLQDQCGYFAKSFRLITSDLITRIFGVSRARLASECFFPFNLLIILFSPLLSVPKIAVKVVTMAQSHFTTGLLENINIRLCSTGVNVSNGIMLSLRQNKPMKLYFQWGYSQFKEFSVSRGGKLLALPCRILRASAVCYFSEYAKKLSNTNLNGFKNPKAKDQVGQCIISWFLD